MIVPEQVAGALERIDPRDRELLALSLRRRVPDEALALVYDIQPPEVARRRAAAIERLAEELGVQRGADLGAVLKALLEEETWSGSGGRAGLGVRGAGDSLGAGGVGAESAAGGRGASGAETGARGRRVGGAGARGAGAGAASQAEADPSRRRGRRRPSGPRASSRAGGCRTWPWRCSASALLRSGRRSA